MSDTDADANDVAGLLSNAALELMTDLSAPQERYVSMIEQGGAAAPMDGMLMTYARDYTDHVLRHSEVFSSATMMGLGNIRPLIPLNVDPPAHSKYRKILDPLFAPKQMEKQEADITMRVNHFIDAFEERGSCNFTDEFAELFPSAVFLGLMGFPWSELDNLMRLRDGILHPDKVDPEAWLDLDRRTALTNKTGQEIYEYFNGWLDERERNPQDDILTHFIQAEIDGDRLSREEILDICFLFLIAGLDTVSDSLTLFWAFLARNDAHRREITEDESLIPAAVEELLRWESPVPVGVPRTALVDTELPDGTTVAAGTVCIVSYGAANMDPSEFPDPFAVRFDRETNRHIAFGGGVHRCLGSHLARRELRVALREWHRRIPNYRITPGHEDLQYPPGLRHIKDLMLSWD